MLDTGYDKNKEDLVLDTGYDKDMEYRVMETHSEPPRVLHTQWRMSSNIMCVTYIMTNDQ